MGMPLHILCCIKGEYYVVMNKATMHELNKTLNFLKVLTAMFFREKNNFGRFIMAEFSPGGIRPPSLYPLCLRTSLQSVSFVQSTLSLAPVKL